MWDEVVTLFWEYMGTGLIVILYLLCLVYLFLKEKRKHIRILFIYVPVVLLVLYFNPLFAGIVYGVAGSEIYYRILWLLPITVVTAYTCVDIYGRLKGKKKGILALCMAGIIMLSGSYIYSNPFFARAENRYHMPNSVVHICDAIIVPGREVMAVFPRELVQYVRQYSALVCMPYGREVTVERWGYNDALAAAMDEEVLDMEKLAPLTKEAGCHYIILPMEKELLGNPSDYEWEWFWETDGYVIYRDVTFSLEL